jgi:hypothetical protein
MSHVHGDTAVGTRIVRNAALMSWSKVLTPLMTNVPPFCQCVRTLARDSDVFALSTRTSTITSVPPATSIGMPITSLGPNSRTTTSRILSGSNAAVVTVRRISSSEGTSSEAPFGSRRMSTLVTHGESEKKCWIPRSAAASRSCGSFWSGRHCGVQKTNAEISSVPAWHSGFFRTEPEVATFVEAQPRSVMLMQIMASIWKKRIDDSRGSLRSDSTVRSVSIELRA